MALLEITVRVITHYLVTKYNNVSLLTLFSQLRDPLLETTIFICPSLSVLT